MRIVFYRLAVKKYLVSVGRGDYSVAEIARFQLPSTKYFFDIELTH